ncbi:DUF803-domain-containing protein [Phellopilus nigrolimitatus]|nr:DUF803-domain-containing protein [Phellopilus nigrolimitatus]
MYFDSSLPGLTRLGEGDEEEADSTASFIGIIVAISGNVLISLALNCQKLAHLRLERERNARSGNGSTDGTGHAQYTKTSGRKPLGERIFSDAGGDGVTENLIVTGNGTADDDEDDDDDDDEERTRVGSSQRHGPNSDVESDHESIPFPGSHTPTRHPSTFRDRAHSLLLETEPLLIVSRGVASPRGSIRGAYGSRGVSTEAGQGSRQAKTRNGFGLLMRIFSAGSKGKAKADHTDLESTAAPVEIRVGEERSGSPTPAEERSRPTIKFAEPGVTTESPVGGYESDYLKSKLWWFGFLLMNVGEMGNFVSYAFAPASIVAPLGTFALVANCFLSPLMLKETFRKRDLFGIGIAILGAITVVLSANPSDTRLDPGGLIRAITRHAFIVLAAVYAAGITLLVCLSSRKVGQEHVYIDVGACALFGGFTVLSTKAFSSLLTKEWAAVFKEWITYPVLVTLVGTGVGQIRYLNRALMKFDSKIVIPTQFVLFNLSAIVGSAVLYGDFRRHRYIKCLHSCTGAGQPLQGVFMLTWGTNVEQGKESAPSGSGQENERPERTGFTELVLPSTPATTRPGTIVRAKSSSMSLVGLSPAQRVVTCTDTG